MTSYLSDFLLDTVPRYEAVDHDLPVLSDTMGSGKRLNVIVRIPVRVVDENCVSCRQVDTWEESVRFSEIMSWESRKKVENWKNREKHQDKNCYNTHNDPA